MVEGEEDVKMPIGDSAKFVDDLFFISIFLLFLMINYSMPLASIYSNMVFIVLFMYIVPILFGWFKWIPVSDKKNRVNEIIAGVAAAIGFIWFYNNILIEASPMAAIFAATAFGESVLLGKAIFGIPIPIIETVFFFVVLPTWALWKMGKSMKRDLFSRDNIIIMIAFAAVFTIFHATSKGLTSNLDLIATAVFGVISIGLVIHFGAILPALILHIVVNSKSVGLLEGITTGVSLSSPIVLIIGGAVVIYLITRKQGLKLPFLTT